MGKLLRVLSDQFEQMSSLFSHLNMALQKCPAQGKLGVQAYSVRKIVRPLPRPCRPWGRFASTGLHEIWCALAFFIPSPTRECIATPVVRSRLKAMSACGLRIPIRPPSVGYKKTHGELTTVLINFLRSSHRFLVVLYKLTKGARLNPVFRYASPAVSIPDNPIMPLRDR